MGIQKIIKREDIIEGEYIPTIGVSNKTWSTDGAGNADWRDNPALVSPTTTKGDIIVHGNVSEESLAVGPDGYILTSDSTTGTGLAWKYLGNLQKEVTTSYTILVADDKYTIFFNSASPITVTIDTIALDNVEVDFYNIGAGAVTFVQGTAAAVGFPDGTQLLQDKVAALIKFMANENYKLKGELI